MTSLLAFLFAWVAALIQGGTDCQVGLMHSLDEMVLVTTGVVVVTKDDDYYDQPAVMCREVACLADECRRL